MLHAHAPGPPRVPALTAQWSWPRAAPPPATLNSWSGGSAPPGSPAPAAQACPQAPPAGGRGTAGPRMSHTHTHTTAQCTRTTTVQPATHTARTVSTRRRCTSRSSGRTLARLPGWRAVGKPARCHAVAAVACCSTRAGAAGLPNRRAPGGCPPCPCPILSAQSHLRSERASGGQVPASAKRRPQQQAGHRGRPPGHGGWLPPGDAGRKTCSGVCFGGCVRGKESSSGPRGKSPA